VYERERYRMRTNEVYRIYEELYLVMEMTKPCKQNERSQRVEESITEYSCGCEKEMKTKKEVTG
jgi:predicted SprT family Zn-dependent metalloprotease